jgi:diadenosine tetraphosphate (Ap4A) HIT family hydrolase
MTAQEVSKKLSVIYNVQYELTIQNGKDAGQTVSHVHIHLCPKPQGDNAAGLEKAKDGEIAKRS